MRVLSEPRPGRPPQFAVFVERSLQRLQSSIRGPMSSDRTPSKLDDMTLSISGLKGWVFQAV